MRRYSIVIEVTGMSLAAYLPDLSECVATGDSEEGVEKLPGRISKG
jgi:hypothetical protein